MPYFEKLSLKMLILPPPDEPPEAPVPYPPSEPFEFIAPLFSKSPLYIIKRPPVPVPPAFLVQHEAPAPAPPGLPAPPPAAYPDELL
jgi:hypothetical protein